MSYQFRKAKIEDIGFISKAIIEAEKSGSDKIGLASIFNLSETEVKSYLAKMLEEEIDGCEFSLSSFLIAEYSERPVATFAGWIETENDDHLPSGILKSNLLGYILPKEKLAFLKEKSELMKSIQLDREPHSLQLEYAFVDEGHKGQRIINKIIDLQLSRAKDRNSSVKKCQVQVFENNLPAIKAYERSGFHTTYRKESNIPGILDYFPGKTKLIMERKI